MKKLNKLFALTTLLALLTGQVQGQPYSQPCCEESDAYADCCQSSTMSALLPIGALAVAAVIIATTNRHHGGHHGSSCSSGSSSHAHSHCSSSY